MANASGTTTNGHERFRNWGPWIGFLLAIVAAIGLLSAGFELGRIVVPLFFASGLMGWIGGIVLSPITPGEKKLFSDFGKGVTTLVTGFLIGKLDRLFDLAFGQGAKIDFVWSALVFIGALCLGGLCPFIWRTYISKPADAETLIAEAIAMLKSQNKKPSVQVEKVSDQLTHTIQELSKASA